MGQIISTKRSETRKGVVVEALLDEKEYLQLQGHMDNVLLFSENIADTRTNISQRGKNYATKYFLIPRQFRKGFNFNFSKEVACQRFDSKDKVIFVYMVNKFQ